MKNLNFKVTEELNEILEKAYRYSVEHQQKSISTEVIMMCIVKKYLYAKEVDIDSKILLEQFNKLTMEQRIKLEKDILNLVGRISNQNTMPAELFNGDNIAFSSAADDIFSTINEDARIKRIISADSQTLISTEDFFVTVLVDDNLEITGILESYNISCDEILAHRLENATGAILKEKRIEAGEEEDEVNKSDEEFERAGQRKAVSAKRVDPNSKTPALDQFAINMTDNAESGKYDPVVGRDKEISQIIEILCCRKKNNAVLLGDPGCGKTSVVESLAQRIVSNNVPEELKGKRIFSLDLNALVSGTTYRGQYEQRLQDIIKEVTENRDIIIFIDEIHNLIGNGSSSGNGDAANILKPYLARGEFQCVGSTTIDEYRKFIEKDGALKRRFSPVYVNEPSISETIDILKGLSKTYSNFHNVSYSEEVIKKCVEWSGKYINDRFFPDKAISVLDMASSITKLRKVIDTSVLDSIERQIEDLSEQIKKLIEASDFDNAKLIRDKKVELEKAKNTEIERLNAEKSSNRPEVTLDDVSQVIHKISNVPIDKIMSSDVVKVRAMKEKLEQKVIGQPEAVQQVTMALQRNILGLRDPKKPICSLLLVGPTGVGKSLISKMVAKEFMGSEDNLITISCSEYMQDWAESKLLGSAPGYVGYSDSEPRLYILKRKPYSVLLIDEVEKSSKNLYNIWLNMLEEGEITLSTGEKISCRNTIIIFTGNVGTKSLALKGNGIGFDKLEGKLKRQSDVATVMKEVKKEFRPEFINRLTNIVVFNSLGTEELNKIFYLELEKLQTRLKENNGYELTVSDSLRDFIVSKCEPEYGARSLQRLLIEHIEQEICKAMLDQDITGKTKINADYKDEKVSVIFE